MPTAIQVRCTVTLLIRLNAILLLSGEQAGASSVCRVLGELDHIISVRVHGVNVPIAVAVR